MNDVEKDQFTLERPVELPWYIALIRKEWATVTSRPILQNGMFPASRSFSSQRKVGRQLLSNKISHNLLLIDFFNWLFEVFRRKSMQYEFCDSQFAANEFRF